MQGEGVYAGTRQTFIRFYGCNRACDYCDTPEARVRTGPFEYGGERFDNPVDAAFITKRITERAVAVTGGEPLLQPDFLARICKDLRTQGKEIYLETNGTLPDALHEVIDCVDIIALDFKIASATGEKTPWDAHAQCLRIAAQKKTFVKIVVNRTVTSQEITCVCDIIEGIDKHIPLVIQPIAIKPIGPYMEIQKQMLTRLPDVRIIPQIHKLLGLR
jgi:organic radical activating enzyme